MRVDVLPMTDDAGDHAHRRGRSRRQPLDLHFQEYWVHRGAPGPGEGDPLRRASTAATPAPGRPRRDRARPTRCCSARPTRSCRSVRSSRCRACGMRWPARPRGRGLADRRRRSPRRDGGQADARRRARGLRGRARRDAYRDLLDAWVIDDARRALAARIADEPGTAVAVTDTVMRDDDVAARWPAPPSSGAT